MNLTACHLGPTDYREGLELQRGLVDARASGEVGDLLLFPDHPPVLTVGRGGREDSLLVDRDTLRGRGIEVFDVSRGGDVTWHGPGQLVGYALVDVAARGRDLHVFLRGIEETLIRVLAGYGIAAERSSGRTGVWVGERKIASIGIAVRRWVSYHGFALNVCPDLSAFDVIHPCGLHGVRMTSVADQLGASAPALAAVRERAAHEFATTLGYDGCAWVAAGEVRSMAAGRTAA
jgi:lipoate-protein ligase B